MIGTQLGPYRILEKIGAGGMGVVYRAEDPRLGRDVAIKVLPTAFSTDPDRLRRFEKEVRTAGALSHPNIIDVHDVGQHEGSPYLVTEFLTGETLRERLRHGPLPCGKAVEFAAQIARGLAAAHAKGIVHRDLKPENLFVTREGRLKILDFGLAKLVSRGETGESAGRDDSVTTTALTEAGVVLGTAGYMSPEQARGENADARSDLFALGAILYEMLAGRRAFHGATVVETLSAILNAEPPELATIQVGIPPALARIVRCCLEKTREERVQSAHDVALALEALAGIASPGAPPIPPGHRATKWRIPVVLGAGLLVAAIGTTAYLAGHRTAGGSAPTYQRLTSQRGFLGAARFAPDGRTIVYSAAWDGDSLRLFTTRLGSPESSPLDLPVAQLAAVAPSGELLVQLHPTTYFGLGTYFGTLARAPLAGGGPREIAEDVAFADWSHDGSGVAVVRRVGGKFRLEFPAGKVLYETPGYISEPRVSPQGDHVAFINHPSPGDDAGSVEVVDLSGNLRTLSMGWISAAGLAWSPRGEEVWFSAAEKGSARKLHAVSLEGKHRMLLAIPGGIRLLDVSPRGNVLMVRETRSLEMLGLAPGEVRERNMSWLDASFPCDLSADGKTLLFVEQGEGVGPAYAACLRKTSGSPVVRLGDGLPTALSPNGKWALAILYDPGARLRVLPTRAGEPLTLEPGPIERYQWANWMPDGKRIVLSGYEPDQGMRCYIQDLVGGPPRPVTPEGTQLYYPCSPVSPDGQFLVAKDAQEHPALYPLQGGEPRPILGLTSADWPICWSGDGRFLFVQRSGEIPARVDRLDPRTGDRKPWKELFPADPAGVTQISSLRISADESSYAYCINRVVHDLYLVEGLR